jgi:hypothetical protein
LLMTFNFSKCDITASPLYPIFRICHSIFSDYFTNLCKSHQIIKSPELLSFPRSFLIIVFFKWN